MQINQTHSHSQDRARRIVGGVFDSIALTYRLFRDILIYSGVVLGTLAFFMADDLAKATHDQRLYAASRVILGVSFVAVVWHVFLSSKLRRKPSPPATAGDGIRSGQSCRSP